MKDPLYASVFAIKDELDILKTGLLEGVDSWDRYNQLVGRARGLRQALDIIENVLREDEEEDGN